MCYYIYKPAAGNFEAVGPSPQFLGPFAEAVGSAVATEFLCVAALALESKTVKNFWAGYKMMATNLLL